MVIRHKNKGLIIKRKTRKKKLVVGVFAVSKKIVSMACISGMLITMNLPLFSAFEAHVINVTAQIVNDVPSIDPPGGEFCNDGELEVELSVTLEGADIYYTIDGSEPECYANGFLYSDPFPLLESATVKAVSCHDGKQSAVMSEEFDVSPGYCEPNLKINKVYHNVDADHGISYCYYNNEWVELYNPTNAEVDVSGWVIRDNYYFDIIPPSDPIPPLGYAVISGNNETWQYWNIPNEVVKISLGSKIGNGLSDTADMLVLEDSSGNVVDQMNWGTPYAGWWGGYYNSGIWNPGVPKGGDGDILGRSPNGHDTDQVSDWEVFELPSVTVIIPNGGEIWYFGEDHDITWSAFNNNGDDLDLSIDIYFSNNSGATWANIVMGTENDGVYEWENIPFYLFDEIGGYYSLRSSNARIKVVATDHTRNFMLSDWDMSDNDFCPPIDCSSLTPEEMEFLIEIGILGELECVVGGGDSVSGATASSGSVDTGSETQDDISISDGDGAIDGDGGGDIGMDTDSDTNIEGEDDTADVNVDTDTDEDLGDGAIDGDGGYDEFNDDADGVDDGLSVADESDNGSDDANDDPNAVDESGDEDTLPADDAMDDNGDNESDLEDSSAIIGNDDDEEDGDGGISEEDLPEEDLQDDGEASADETENNTDDAAGEDLETTTHDDVITEENTKTEDTSGDQSLDGAVDNESDGLSADPDDSVIGFSLLNS